MRSIILEKNFQETIKFKEISMISRRVFKIPVDFQDFQEL